jgi:membrane protease YdiL (CAAX protease family)
MIWEFIFYFGFVAVTEELLFRGLLYHLLEQWKGYRWAIWGTSFGFVLWHIFGQGPLVGFASLLYGLIFALARWRSEGILGLILGHGLIDFLAAQMLPAIDVVSLGRPEISCMACMLSGLALIAATPIYFWKIHPILEGKISSQVHRGTH